MSLALVLLFAASGLPGVLALIAGILLLVGFLTPVAAALAVVATAIRAFRGPAPIDFLEIALALALCCLGPGAWSLDSRLFGRREIVIPPEP